MTLPDSGGDSPPDSAAGTPQQKSAAGRTADAHVQPWRGWYSSRTELPSPHHHWCCQPRVTNDANRTTADAGTGCRPPSKSADMTVAGTAAAAAAAAVIAVDAAEHR